MMSKILDTITVFSTRVSIARLILILLNYTRYRERILVNLSIYIIK